MPRPRVDRRELTLIAVTIGPGSFTGVRVGLAAARGLAVGLAVPLAGITTTAVLLAQAASRDRLVIAAIDSRLGDWFCAIGEGDAAPFVTSARDLAVRIAGRPCLVVGTGAKALADDLLAAGIDTIVEEAAPDPVTLARLAGDAGVDAWRARNAAGRPAAAALPARRQHHLAGRRAPHRRLNDRPFRHRAAGRARSRSGRRAACRIVRAPRRACLDAAGLAELVASPGVAGLLLQVDGHDAGFALCRVAADEAELLTIAVRPARRRQGAARRLLAAVIDHVRDARGADAIP